jgi:hypothetical protein
MTYRYKTVKRGGKTVLLHRHIAEQLLGRPLTADEHVHHANHLRDDNRPDNITVLSADAHHQLHADERLIHQRTKTCVVCNAAFTPHKSKRKRAKTCSPCCANTLRSRTEKATKAAKAANYIEPQQQRRVA